MLVVEGDYKAQNSSKISSIDLLSVSRINLSLWTPFVKKNQI